MSFGNALGAAFSAAALFLSSSRSLHRVVRISTVSVRSFLSVASFASSSLHASRSIFRFSFSNSSGFNARVLFFPFLTCLVFRAGSDCETDGSDRDALGDGKGRGVSDCDNMGGGGDKEGSTGDNSEAVDGVGGIDPGGLTRGTNGGASLSRQTETLGEVEMEDVTVVMIVVVGVIRKAELEQEGVIGDKELKDAGVDNTGNLLVA